MEVGQSIFYPTSLYYEIRNEVCKILVISNKSKNKNDVFSGLTEIVMSKTNIKWNGFYDFLDWLKLSVSSLKPLGASTSNENSAIESRLNELLVALKSYRSNLCRASKK